MTTPPILRVLIVAAADLIRARVSAQLFDTAGGFERADALSSVADARAWARGQRKAEVAIVDLELPEAVEVVRDLTTVRPELPCVAITGATSEGRVPDVLRAGARAVIRAQARAGHLAHMLRAAVAGEGSVPADLAHRMLGGAGGEGAERSEYVNRLTGREREILTLLAKGLGYAELGGVLGIKLGTVQHHIKRIYLKLDVTSKAEAAIIAVALGLV